MKQVEYDKDLEKFYGSKGKEEATTAEMKAKQSKGDALKIFFAVNEKESSIAIVISFRSEIGRSPTWIWWH
jgi:hypothetical protein